MEAKSQRLNEQEGAISALDAAIEDLNVAEKASSTPPTKAILGSVIVLLTLIRVCFLLLRYYLLWFTSS